MPENPSEQARTLARRSLLVPILLLKISRSCFFKTLNPKAIDRFALDVQHSPFTTVGEALWISARLRFDKTVSDATVKLFIQEIEELVELVTLRGSLVGMPGKDGLSVEQRKRLTIAVELVANPSVIFMDVSSICNIILDHSLHNVDVLHMCTTLT